MKKFIIVSLAVVVGVAVVIWLSGSSRETIGGASQNIERPTGAVEGPVKGSRYTDPSGFSFEMPSGYTARAISDGLGKTITVEKQGSGFQIAVSPYDEPVAGFGEARIRKDLPDLVMKNVKDFSVAGGKGVSFDSDTGREIWFVSGETLYQISAPQSEAVNAQTAAATFKPE